MHGASFPRFSVRIIAQEEGICYTYFIFSYKFVHDALNDSSYTNEEDLEFTMQWMIVFERIY